MMPMPMEVERKIKALEHCLGRGYYEDAVYHSAGLLKYCFERFKTLSGSDVTLDQLVEEYIKSSESYTIEGPSVLDEMARKLD